ncbi:hypothetical protein Mal15_42200 [Stieleria maiorica]|uniref:Uncharacterized protein n=1 Tax=Stieleria maiorica TaxID=2795974 RepID=A0A5B9MJK4_9BACT|nr:hypothetical protein [Stieleria maiorica]QEG00151.1 hypothetical protein Mal15_42200 [Stieleria maiorica]
MLPKAASDLSIKVRQAARSISQRIRVGGISLGVASRLLDAFSRIVQSKLGKVRLIAAFNRNAIRHELKETDTIFEHHLRTPVADAGGTAGVQWDVGAIIEPGCRHRCLR